MIALSKFERFLLSQPVPSLNLPALDPEDTVSLWERAATISYGDNELAPRGEGNLVALLKVLGVIPATRAEKMAVIHSR